MTSPDRKRSDWFDEEPDDDDSDDQLNQHSLTGKKRNRLREGGFRSYSNGDSHHDDDYDSPMDSYLGDPNRSKD